MSDEKIHGIDASVPSDTDQFDSIADQQEGVSEEHKLMVIQLNRYGQLAKALLNTENVPVNVLAELILQKSLARAELIVIFKILEEELGIKTATILKRVAEQLDQMLELEQIQYKVIITPEGVFQDGKPNG